MAPKLSESLWEGLEMHRKPTKLAFKSPSQTSLGRHLAWTEFSGETVILAGVRKTLSDCSPGVLRSSRGHRKRRELFIGVTEEHSNVAAGAATYAELIRVDILSIISVHVGVSEQTKDPGARNYTRERVNGALHELKVS